MLRLAKRHWAAILGVVCGAELLIAVLLLGAGATAFVSLEGGLVVVAFGIAALGAIGRRRRKPAQSPT